MDPVEVRRRYYGGVDLREVFKNYTVEDLKALEHVLPYGYLAGLVNERPPRDVPREMIEYFVQNPHLGTFTLDQSISVLRRHKDDTEILAKMLFSSLIKKPSILGLLQECEEDVELHPVIDILGILGMITAKDIAEFRGGYREKLKWSAYRQILTDQQIELRMIFDFGEMTEEQPTWMRAPIIYASKDIDTVSHLALTFSDIREAVFRMIVQDRCPTIRNFSTLLQRLPEDEQEVLCYDLCHQLNHLSNLPTTMKEVIDQSHRVVCFILEGRRFNELNDRAFRRIIYFIRRPELADTIMFVMDDFLRAQPSDVMRQLNDEAFTELIKHHDIDDPRVEKYAHLAGDIAMKRLSVDTRFHRMPQILRDKLQVFFENNKGDYYKAALLNMDEDSHYRRFLAGVSSEMRFVRQTLTIKNRTFEYDAPGNIVENLQISQIVKCKHCPSSYMEPWFREKGGLFDDFVCDACHGDEDEYVECPVCESGMELEFLMCRHVVCRTCLPSLRNGCPTCRGPTNKVMIWQLNLLVESLMQDS